MTTCNLPEYLNLCSYARKFTPEDVWFRGGYPDTRKATLDLIESGQTAWGFPDFEQIVWEILTGWLDDGHLIRVQFYAKALVESAEGYSREWLQCLAEGDIWGHPAIAFNYKVCPIRGLGNAFLHPLNLQRRKELELHREETRAWLRKDPYGYCRESVAQHNNQKAIAQEWHINDR